MLDKNDRIIIESIKGASRITLIYDGNKVSFAPSKKLSHDIALAVQSHYNQLNKE